MTYISLEAHLIYYHQLLVALQHLLRPNHVSASHLQSQEYSLTVSAGRIHVYLRCENSFWDGWQSCEGEITEVIFQIYMKYNNCYGWFERPAPLCTTQELTQQIYLFIVAD